MKKIFFIFIPTITLFSIITFSCKRTEAEPDVLKVYDLSETINGLTYADLEQISTKWLLGTSADKSAASDNDGKLAGITFQPNSNVTILPFNFGGKSVRTLTIPASKPVYFAILGYVYWYWDNDPCDPTFKPAANQSVESFLTPFIDELFLAKHTVSATLDGQDIVPDVKKYFVKTKAFDLAVPDDYQDPTCDNKGKLAHTISHSYALLLKLPKGKHTVVYKGAFPNADPKLNFETEVTWNLTVE
jgi:hypothetical protein